MHYGPSLESASIRRTTAILFAHGRRLITTFAVLTLPAQIVLSLMSDSSAPLGLGILAPERRNLTILAILTSRLISTFADGVVGVQAIAIVQGKAPSIRDGVSIAGNRILTMLVVVLLQTIAYSLGIFTLGLLSVVLASIWWVSLPAILGENAGVFGAFMRSARLTQGFRSGTATLVILMIGLYIFLFCTVFVLGSFVSPALASITGYVLMLIVETSATICRVASWHELRRAKEGPEVAAVFT